MFWRYDRQTCSAMDGLVSRLKTDPKGKAPCRESRRSSHGTNIKPLFYHLTGSQTLALQGRGIEATPAPSFWDRHLASRSLIRLSRGPASFCQATSAIILHQLPICAPAPRLRKKVHFVGHGLTRDTRHGLDEGKVHSSTYLSRTLRLFPA